MTMWTERADFEGIDGRSHSVSLTYESGARYAVSGWDRCCATAFDPGDLAEVKHSEMWYHLKSSGLDPEKVFAAIEENSGVADIMWDDQKGFRIYDPYGVLKTGMYVGSDGWTYWSAEE